MKSSILVCRLHVPYFYLFILCFSGLPTEGRVSKLCSHRATHPSLYSYISQLRVFTRYAAEFSVIAGSTARIRTLLNMLFLEVQTSCPVYTTSVRANLPSRFSSGKRVRISSDYECLSEYGRVQRATLRWLPHVKASRPFVQYTES